MDRPAWAKTNYSLGLRGYGNHDAPVNTAESPEKTDPRNRWIAWGAIITASTLPEILCRLGGNPPLWLPLAQIGLLLFAAILLALSERTKVLCGFLLTLAALRLGWSVFTPAIAFSDTVAHWARGLDWGARLFLGRLLPVTGALVMIISLWGSGLSRRDLFLQRGNLGAPAQPEPILWFRRPIPWTRFGSQLLVIFGIVLPIFLVLSLRPDFSHAWRIWKFLPWGIMTAWLNAANEEFQFRAVPLARLRGVVSEREAALLTATLFGLGHFYGQPSGPIGAVMAGIAGWIWAKSMLETRGFFWAFLIHFLQDLVIFIFLAMTVVR
jgi:membrane protease YdiL (CAAX protease family)